MLSKAYMDPDIPASLLDWRLSETFSKSVKKGQPSTVEPDGS